MPWRCPACSTQVQHAPSETMPREGVVYRCHVCRIELVVDPHTKKMTVAPFGTPDPPGKKQSPQQS